MKKVPEENGDEPNNKNCYCDKCYNVIANKKGEIRTLGFNKQKKRRIHV